jgi:hypothetical protein
VHFVVRALNKGQEDNEAVKRFITYTLEQHVREHPGQKIIILFDLSETGLRHLVSLIENLLTIYIEFCIFRIMI